MTDLGSMAFEIPRSRPLPTTPVDRAGVVERLRLTVVGAGQALLMAPALILGILGILVWPLLLVVVGFALAQAVVPATRHLTRVSRWLAGELLGEEVPERYADTSDRNAFGRAIVWMRDEARWRDFAHLWFTATGGFVMSLIPTALLTTPVVYLVGTILDFSGFWLLLLFLSGPLVLAWWFVTPVVIRARAIADRSILGVSRVEHLERRVTEVAESRSEALDHSAAEVRRIERDLHDGAQARIAAVGMNVGLAEKLMATDPTAAAELLREARETTVSALEDLRSVVRGIHPPVLADRGLPGAIEALTVPIPLPITVALDLPGPLPAPLESAAYFAVAECLANTVKHSGATRAWITGNRTGDLVALVVGDNGRGGAVPTGTGLGGVASRLAAFDGTMTVDSPSGGPTVVTMELPCPNRPTH